MVFHRISRRRGSRGDTQFAVNRAYVEIDGDDTDDELFGNLGAGHAPSEQAKHLSLTSSKPIGIAG